MKSLLTATIVTLLSVGAGTVAAQTQSGPAGARYPSTPYPTTNAPAAKPSTLVPDGTTPGGATRLRLVAQTPAPSGTAPTPNPPSLTVPGIPPAASPSATAKTPSTVPVIPPGAIPSNAGDSSYPPRAAPKQEPPSTNDPTNPGPGTAIRELLGNQEKTPSQAPQATPGLPLVRLRGRVAVRNKPVIAIVEIDGRMYAVRPNDEFTVNADGAPTPMKVLKLTATEMQIELVNRRAVINLY